MIQLPANRGLLHLLKVAKHWSTMLQERNGSLKLLQSELQALCKATPNGFNSGD